MDDRARVRAIVRGVVQGVGYRCFAMRLARDYGLVGWVRNRGDGGVEVEVQGERGIVQSFLRDLRIGPRAAEVTSLDAEEIPLDPGEKRFDIRT